MTAPTPRRVRTVDIHAHWYPAEWLRLFERDGAREGAELKRPTRATRSAPSGLTNAFTEEFVDLDRRLAAMDRAGVDVHALSLTTPMVYWASPALGVALAQSFNDAASAAFTRGSRRASSGSRCCRCRRRSSR